MFFNCFTERKVNTGKVLSMERKKQKMIEFLLDNANPSIKRRVKSEILHNLKPDEAALYQEQIMTEPMIQRIMACQQENGWIGRGLHRDLETQEGGTKYLGEKGINKETPVLKRAMDAFATIPLDDKIYTPNGRVLDVYKYPTVGNELIRCACIARAGYADEIDINPLVQLSLDSFKRVLEVDSILDVSRLVKSGNRRRVFKDYEKWPCRYHLDILAHTDSWKTEENIKTLADSVAKMMRTDNSDLIDLKADVWVGHVLGACECFPSQGFSLKRIEHKTGKEYLHFEYLEWLARCGVVPYIPALGEIIDEIAAAIDDDGICHAYAEEFMFRKWGPYAGLQLEVDWRSKIRKACDITFRALLILHYSGTES